MESNQKLLFCTTLSPTSIVILKHAFNLASFNKIDVEILHCIEGDADQKAQAEARLSSFVTTNILPEHRHVIYHLRVRTESFGQALVHYAQLEGYRFLLMGRPILDADSGIYSIREIVESISIHTLIFRAKHTYSPINQLHYIMQHKLLDIRVINLMVELNSVIHMEGSIYYENDNSGQNLKNVKAVIKAYGSRLDTYGSKIRCIEYDKDEFEENLNDRDMIMMSSDDVTNQSFDVYSDAGAIFIYASSK